jgi:hypothetical protein
MAARAADLASLDRHALEDQWNKVGSWMLAFFSSTHLESHLQQKGNPSRFRQKVNRSKRCRQGQAS